MSRYKYRDAECPLLSPMQTDSAQTLATPAADRHAHDALQRARWEHRSLFTTAHRTEPTLARRRFCCATQQRHDRRSA